MYDVEEQEAHWLLKKRLSRRTEKLRIDRLIGDGFETTKNKKVFIIHGSDTTNLLRLRTMLKEELKLEPVILSEEDFRGQTIIQNIEETISDIGYAIALLTPDDKFEGEIDDHPRPNVFIETGMFYGKLGRDRVCLLKKEGAYIPSDFQGILYIEFKNSVEEVFRKIRDELKTVFDL